MSILHDVVAVGCGGLVGFSLGLMGGGGSILAVPLLVYIVGVQSPHDAVGTSALAVAASAAANLVGHARAGTVRWGCAIVFAICGSVGAAVGADVGKLVSGAKLLSLFGLLMILVGILMLRRRSTDGSCEIALTRGNAVRLVPLLVIAGFAIGILSGFFGIGGGFLIVPGLVAATGMPLINAIGSSLVAVTLFGLTTAVSYAASGLVDWSLARLFILGGIIGGVAGVGAAHRLASHKHALTLVFSGMIIAVGVYVVIRGGA